MTYLPIPQAGTGGSGNVTATIDDTNANWGAGSWQTERTTQPVETYEVNSLNVLNQATEPPVT